MGKTSKSDPPVQAGRLSNFKMRTDWGRGNLEDKQHRRDCDLDDNNVDDNADVGLSPAVVSVRPAERHFLNDENFCAKCGCLLVGTASEAGGRATTAEIKASSWPRFANRLNSGNNSFISRVS